MGLVWEKGTVLPASAYDPAFPTPCAYAASYAFPFG